MEPSCSDGSVLTADGKCVQPAGQSLQRGQAQATGAGASRRATNNAVTNAEEPRTVQAPNPYGNIPSLLDLNTQVPLRLSAQPLRRFGSEAFLIGTGNANELPMDVPVGPDYVLGPGDSLVLNMWGGESNRVSLVIDPQGEVALPEAGTLAINGMTIAQAQTAIEEALATRFQNERVELSLTRVRTVRVYVVGDVQRPGAYDVSSLSSPLNALYAAGGPTGHGSLRILKQYRGKNLVQQFDLYDFLLRGIRTNIGRLEPGDTILVPPAGPQVAVRGMVHRPAIYELNGETQLEQVLDLAGGVLITASLKQINVERIEAHQSHTMLSLQLSDNQADVKKEIADFKVQGGDEVVISQILPYNNASVYLEGHVYRPGKYPYHEGMTINDLLRSYQDVLPEPAARAEIIRLEPPDYRPETIPVNLPDLLIGNSPLPLQPFDVVQVYGRYQADAPTVTISGKVLRPGRYPMSQGMTVADLVRMAGGFTRSAYRDEADLSSYDIQNGQKVIVKATEVAVEKALEGDKSADVTLRAGDVVSIRQLAGWQDIGATVSINGEVEHPGTYAIVPGERLSGVLKQAGGFRDTAYPPAAVLERALVRELEEQNRQQMILRIENTPIAFNPGAMNQQAAQAMQTNLQQQRAQTLAALRNQPVTGRLVINISDDIHSWENTSADIELRAGDTLNIPKRPNFVAVAGQVYNPTAISYVPGRDVEWYLRKTGGPTRNANTKNIYVLHADGSVEPRKSGWGDDRFMHARMRPGDTIFVPEKIYGGSLAFQNVIAVAQIMAAAALPLAIAGTL